MPGGSGQEESCGKSDVPTRRPPALQASSPWWRVRLSWWRLYVTWTQLSLSPSCLPRVKRKAPYSILTGKVGCGHLVRRRAGATADSSRWSQKTRALVLRSRQSAPLQRPQVIPFREEAAPASEISGWTCQTGRGSRAHH